MFEKVYEEGLTLMRDRAVFVVTLVCAALLVSGLLVEAQQQGIGAAAFLRRGVDARALGMGGAYVAVVAGYSSAYWNPAGLARNPATQIGGMYTDVYGVGLGLTYVGGSTCWDFQLAQTPSFKLGIGGAYAEFATDVRVTDPYGDPIGLVRYSEKLYSVGTALFWPSLGYFGGTAKIYSFLAPKAGVNGNDATAFGIGFDVGLLASVWDGLTLGIAASDAGDTKVQWHNTPTEPTDIVLGKYTVGAAFTKGGFTVAGDVVFQSKSDNLIRCGAEYTVAFLMLRVGLVKRLGGPFSLTFGVGVNAQDLRIDAAWLQNKEIKGEGARDTIVLSTEFTFPGWWSEASLQEEAKPQAAEAVQEQMGTPATEPEETSPPASEEMVAPAPEEAEEETAD